MRFRHATAALVAMITIVAPAAAEEDCRLTLAASLPMQPGNIHRIIIPAEIDGKPLRLMIDTGSGHTGLTSAAATRMGIETHLITGDVRPFFPYAGGASTQYARLKNFRLGDMTAERVEFFIAPSDWQDADGILGADFLRQFDVEFDFAGAKVNLFRPHPCPGKVVYWTQDAAVAVVPFESERSDKKIRIDMSLDGKSLPAFLDTGAPSTTIGLAAASAWFNVDEKTQGVVQNRGGSYRYRFKTLTLDGITVTNPEITLLPEVNTRGINYRGLLGINILRQLHLYVAYKEHKLYVTSATAH